MTVQQVCFVFLAMQIWHVVFCFAQEPQQAQAQASLTIVNAVSGTNNLFINFDEQSIWPPGFTPGQSTAAVMFPSGRKRAKLTCEGYAPSEVTIDMAAGANCAMVIYPSEQVPDGPDRGKRKLAVFMPSPHLAGTKEMNTMRWKIVLVGTAKSAEVEVNGKRMLLSPLQSSEFTPGSAGVEVKYRGQSLLGASPEDPGQYIVVIFPSGDGLAAALLSHAPFKVPSG